MSIGCKFCGKLLKLQWVQTGRCQECGRLNHGPFEQFMRLKRMKQFILTRIT